MHDKDTLGDVSPASERRSEAQGERTLRERGNNVSTIQRRLQAVYSRLGPAPHGPRTGRNKVHNYGDEPW